MRSHFGRVVAVLGLSALALSACGDEAADEEAFIHAMTEQANLTLPEAECMADEIFNNSGLSEEQINEGSDDFESSQAFMTAFNAALALCTDL